MQSHGGATAVSDHSSPKPKKPKSREVSSRFLSPTSTTTSSSSSSSSSSTENGNHSPNSTLIASPTQKPRSSTNSRNHKSYENSGFFRGLWPSSSAPSPNPLRPDKHIEKPDDRNSSSLLNKQKSFTEFSRLENDKYLLNKENQKPVFGGSMRYAGKLKNLSNDSQNDVIAPGRFSVDENTLRKDFAASYMAPTLSSRRQGIEVASKFMHDITSRARRWSTDSGLNQKPVSSSNSNSSSSNNNSSKIFALKKKKKGNGNWESSTKSAFGSKSGKGVGNILSLGIELLKGKISSTSGSSSSAFGPGWGEDVHGLRLLHNRLVQWRYCNARAEAVNESVIRHAECSLLFVWNGLMKLQHSVIQKKLHLQKEKLGIKLNHILHSQMKDLENWENMERQHSSAVCSTTDYLHSVICRVPLIDGAKVETQSAFLGVRHASDLAASINLMITHFSPTIEETVGVVDELAKVVTQEKLMLEECFELFRDISLLEIQERSLKSSIMQLRLFQQHQNHLYF